MRGLLLSFASVAVAWALALATGLALGRLSYATSAGGMLLRVLTQLRGGLLPFILVPMLLCFRHLPPWLAVGVACGLIQGVAVARWISRQKGGWASLVGGIALGHSGSQLATRDAAARGAVSGALALTAPYVVLLEALLARASGGRAIDCGAWGARLTHQDRAAFVMLLALPLIMAGLEAASARLLQGKRRSWKHG